MKKIVFSVALLLAVGIGAWFIWRPTTMAPAVTFTTIDGKTMAMQDLRGRVVLVKFWATSCVTCVKQMPGTIETYRTFEPQGYETIAVAMSYDPEAYVLNFASSRQLPFPVVRDTNGEIARAFGDVQLTPIAFLIDKQGHIIKRYLGDYDMADFQATLTKALVAG